MNNDRKGIYLLTGNREIREIIVCRKHYLKK